MIQSNLNLKFSPVSSKEYFEGHCVQGIKYMWWQKVPVI